ncbi:MAG: C4-type zinc ribbon domain-containing protein [Caldilinea sp.]
MDIARLYELQKIDANMDKVRRRVAQIRRKLGESETLQQTRADVEVTRTEQEQLHARQLDAELNGRQLAERIQESERRLMSGEVRNAKELEALQASIESMKRQRSQVDDVALDSLQRSEELQRQLAEQRAVLAQLEDGWQTEKGSLQEEETKYRRMFGQLKQQRQSVSDRLGADALSLYTQLSERKAGTAVAAIQNGMCSACNVSLPTGIVNNARNTEGPPVFCPSCGRILFAA